MKRNENKLATYETHAIMDKAKKSRDAKVILPTRQGVDEAKRFVEENKK